MADGGVDLERLCKAHQNARRSLEYFRVERRAAVKQFVGNHWAEDGYGKSVPVNLLGQFISIVGRNLVAKNPRVLLDTWSKPNRPAVSMMQEWCNQEIERMRLDETLRRAVIDALFCVGIVKVALASPPDVAVAGWKMKTGSAFAEVIDLDDFSFDTKAHSFAEAAFMGHMVRVPLDSVRDSSRYSKGRKDLTPSDPRHFNEQGDERVSEMGRGQYGDQEELEDMVNLWEFYVPRKNVVVTLRCDDRGEPEPDKDGGALLAQDWVGPEHGPYHLLGFGVVPGNAMPKAPVMDLVDLHAPINHLMRKIIEQGIRQKEVLPVRSANADQDKNLIDAQDGCAIHYDGEPPKPVNYGNFSQPNLLLVNQLRDVFDRQAGNLAMLGGLAPQSKTASQDEMLNKNSSATLADLQDQAIKMASSVIKALGWYWWHDPYKVMRTQYKIPEVDDASITRTLGPAGDTVDHETGERLSASRTAKWDELNLRVDPYSMQHNTPQSRLQAMNQVVQTIIMPMMPILQQSGVSFDVNAYLKKVARFLDLPDIEEIVTIQEPVVDQPSGGGEKPGMPQETTRNYVRRSLGSDTKQNRDAELTNAMMAGANGEEQ